jgi:hypothetical protein
MTNTLAFYDMATITAVKSFIVKVPGCSTLFLLFLCQHLFSSLLLHSNGNFTLKEKFLKQPSKF